MRHAIDHVFVCCSVDAPEAAALTRLGLKEGTPDEQHGQGTACRRFFFRNAYIELLWVDDVERAKDPTSVRTRLWERWSERQVGACPFGVVFRPRGTGRAEPPFASWSYHPPHLMPDVTVDVAMGTLLTEPELIYWGHPRRPEELRGEPIEHAMPLRDLTAVKIGIPGFAPRTASARAVEATGLVTFAAAPEYVMRLEFDGEAPGNTVDLRPDLPLVLGW